MKTRFSTLDIAFEVGELQRLIGMRVNRVYDVDHRTYLLKLQRPEEKAVLLIESGIRIHSTRFDWPKGVVPSGFAMKLRKHLVNKRLEGIRQLGVDRVVDLQFGVSDAAHHLLLELYDKGNVVLADHQYVILTVLRPRVQGEEKFTARANYPLEIIKPKSPPLTTDRLDQIIADALANEKLKRKDRTLKKILLPFFDYGPALLEHLLISRGLAEFKFDSADTNVPASDHHGLSESQKSLILDLFQEASAKDFGGSDSAGCPAVSKKGYIREVVTLTGAAAGGSGTKELRKYVDFSPMAFLQDQKSILKEFESFDAAVDDYFSNIESQKIEAKAHQKEQQSLKKLENVKRDHAQRLHQLQETQDTDRQRGEIIELNHVLVDEALDMIRSALASQIDWKEITELVKEAAENGDPVASRVRQLKLDVNQMTLWLSNPFQQSLSDDEDEVGGDEDNAGLLVDLDIDLSAQANARRYYDKKRSAKSKEIKTIQSETVAIKSAERHAKQAMREADTIARIVKARKVFWFEKFLWFISSENYLVIGGRDQQQNELIVRRYLGSGDAYVHAEIQGASSVVVKNGNSSGDPVPPKTLNEAGQFALCHSVAWDSKVVVSAYWVHGNQVSKTAPSGEYLTTGSFMIRGKKNFLPPSQMTLGFGFMFKLDEDSVERHLNDRKVRSNLENQVGEEVQQSPVEHLEQLPAETVPQQQEDVEEDEVDVEDEVHVDDGESSEEDEEGKTDETLVEFPDRELEVKFSAGLGLTLSAKASDDVKSGADGVLGEDGVQGPPDQQCKVEFLEDARKNKANNKLDSLRGNAAGIEARPQVDREQSGDPDKASKSVVSNNNNNNNNKRGQHGKRKKIKDRYKDQDEEEKELRMRLLHESQKANDSRKQKKKQLKVEAEEKKKRHQELQLAKQKAKQVQTNKAQARSDNNSQGQQDLHKGDDENDEEDEAASAALSNAAMDDHLNLLNSLTGTPVSEDSLLFAVPVVAPYSTMVNYRYKVKVTPGSAKRGKASRTALNLFTTDKQCPQRDKDLLKSVKDQDISRNLPGKVKITSSAAAKK